MKKLILLIFLFSAVNSSFAQTYELNGQDTINRIDANNLKQGFWIFWGRMKKLPGYADNAKVEEGNYIDSKKHGLWKKYFPTGSVESEVTFQNNRVQGTYVTYYENGKVQEQGTMANGSTVGQFRRFYENGNLHQEWSYNNKGKREGVQKYYFENGKVMIEGEWENGQESGIIKEYYENGDIRAEKNFANGSLDPATTKVFEPKKPIEKKEEVKPAAVDMKPVVVSKDEAPNMGSFNGNGYAKLFGKDKQVAKEGTFKNYELIDGKHYIYNNDGILQRIAVYKNGVYVGDGVISDK
jgi:antitoxin component YwqK of YwqJK toxin-antitoxin module